MSRVSILLSLFAVAFVLCCISNSKGPEYYSPMVLATHPSGGDYVGSGTCLECHSDIHKAHLQTAHYQTSGITSANNILGEFGGSKNKIELADGYIAMVRKGREFYQQAHGPDQSMQSSPSRIDIVIGSGIKGQSHLNWEDDQLFQLQASYYPPSQSWINSPGYPDQFLKRPIRDGCLKCHVTFATNKDFSGQGNRYNKDRMVYGVDCEKCHGPAAKHVTFHRENPDIESARFMIKLDTLPRQGRLDVCAQCHSGPRDRLLQGNSFSYLAGEVLDNYSRNFYTGQPETTLDVHGNQYGLLTSSSCFQLSTDMDCATCHDSHKNQRGLTRHFNSKCASCHTGTSTQCSAAATDLNSMNNNCISCHMPNSPSSAMTVQLGSDGEESPVYVRTHQIGIYARERWLQ